MQQSTDLLVAEIEGIETSSVDQLVQELKFSNSLRIRMIKAKEAEIKLLALQIALHEQSHPTDLCDTRAYARNAKEIVESRFD